MGKRQTLAVRQDGNIVTFALEGYGSRSIDVNQLPLEVQQHLTTYGLITKVLRSYAGKAGAHDTVWQKANSMLDALLAGKTSLKVRKATPSPEAIAIAKALKRVPPRYRLGVAEKLIADGAPITREQLRQEGII